MKAINHKHNLPTLVLVLLLVVSGCQPAPVEQPTVPPQPTVTPQPSATAQPTATQTLPPPTSTATLVPSPTFTPTPGIAHIYAFGDNFSDDGRGIRELREAAANGEIDAETLKIVESWRWDDRVTNGPVAVEVLAEQLNLGLTDYAISGATSGILSEGNDKEIGVLSQIDQFESDLNGSKANPDALYFIFVSGLIDLIASARNIPVDSTQVQLSCANVAGQVIENVSTAITHLTQLGARHFMVVNAFDMSTMPCDVNTEKVELYYLPYQSRILSDLSGKMEDLADQLNIKIVIFDYLAASERIYKNPDQYGITNILDACVSKVTLEERVVCESPDEYFFWTVVYPTGRVNQIIGEAMAEQLNK